MTYSPAANSRPIFLTREGEVFRLSFPYRADLVERMRELPYASFDKQTKSWTAAVCQRSVEQLRRLYFDGLTDVSVDDLVADGEALPQVRQAMLRAGSAKRPFVVHMATRDDHLYSRLRAIPGAQWDKTAQAIAYPPQAAAALSELVERGVVDDQGSLLKPADVVVTFDGRTGRFSIIGDKRAQPVFDRHFPGKDVVEIWQSKGIDVDFSDGFTEEIYRAELVRSGPGIQPASMTMALYPYQAQDVAFAVSRTGSGVFHSPGVGKTPIAIGAGCELLDRGEISRVVFVCPSAIRTQVAREIVRFTTFTHDDVVVVGGSKKKRHDAYARAADAKWLVVHYDVLSRDIDLLKPLCAGALMICDEAHKIKSPTAARTKNAKALARVAARRIAMTGTPVENDPGEWYSVLGQFAVPGSLGTPHEFFNRYQYPGRFGGYEGARNLPELRQRSQVHYTRRLKSEVAEHLPPLRVQRIVLDPEPAYAAALKRAHREARDEIAKGRVAKAKAGVLLHGEDVEDAEAGAEMTAVGMLRAMCSSPRLLAMSDSEAAAAMEEAGLIVDADGPKLDELRVLASELRYAREQRLEKMAAAGRTSATCDEVTGERLVVFTYSRKMADLIAERLREDGVSHRTYTGSTSQGDRDEAVALFTDPDADITALVCTDAAAEGLNLGRCCNLLVNFDVPWNPSTLIQRGNRIHRVDGTAPHYLVLNYTVAGTIEGGILRMLERKADLSDAILGEAGGRAATTGRKTGNDVAALLKEAFDAAEADAERDADGRKAA